MATYNNITRQGCVYLVIIICHLTFCFVLTTLISMPVFARFSHNAIQTLAYFTQTLWRTLMTTEYFLFVYHTTSILAKLSNWCFDEHSLVTSVVLYSLTRATLSVSDESWEWRNTCMWIYIYIYML